MPSSCFWLPTHHSHQETGAMPRLTSLLERCIQNAILKMHVACIKSGTESPGASGHGEQRVRADWRGAGDERGGGALLPEGAVGRAHQPLLRGRGHGAPGGEAEG